MSTGSLSALGTKFVGKNPSENPRQVTWGERGHPPAGAGAVVFCKGPPQAHPHCQLSPLPGPQTPASETSPVCGPSARRRRVVTFHLHAEHLGFISEAPPPHGPRLPYPPAWPRKPGVRERETCPRVHTPRAGRASNPVFLAHSLRSSHLGPRPPPRPSGVPEGPAWNRVCGGHAGRTHPGRVGRQGSREPEPEPDGNRGGWSLPRYLQG